MKANAKDTFIGEHKLIELTKAQFTTDKEEDIAFILSAVSTMCQLHLYVIEGVRRKKVIGRGPIEWRYLHLRSFTFKGNPTSLLEMHHNKVAVVIDTRIEILELFNDKKKKISLKGHKKPIRTIAKVSRETPI